MGPKARDMSETHRRRAAELSFWTHPVEPEPLEGGLSNRNFVVTHRGERLVVRLGDDVPEHGVSRASEVAVSRAAHAVGLSPEVVHAAPGAIVLRHIAGRSLTPADVRDRRMLERMLAVLRVCHREMAQRLGSSVPTFSVFSAIRSYAETLRSRASSFAPMLPTLVDHAALLEIAVGTFAPVFGHNDLLAANWIDDGTRLWLIDWEYAGLNSPLFDLGGLASNNELSDADETWLVESYLERPLSTGDRHRYEAMKCASLLREAMWAMVSASTSTLSVDYPAYALDYLHRFERARVRVWEG